MTEELDDRFAIAALQIPTVQVSGNVRPFPVRRIWCIGRNYADHAKEMGGDPAKEPPFFFSKPADAVVASGQVLKIPPATTNLHYEVELAVAIGRNGSNLDIKSARSLIFGYAVALDMTRRDIQAEAKKTSRPWDMAKGFDQSCPIGPISTVSDVGYLDSGKLHLEIGGETRQEADLSDMIWSIEECIVALSQLVDIAAGDILLTGTPARVGPVFSGDKLIASFEKIGKLTVEYISG